MLSLLASSEMPSTESLKCCKLAVTSLYIMHCCPCHLFVPFWGFIGITIWKLSKQSRRVDLTGRKDNVSKVGRSRPTNDPAPYSKAPMMSSENLAEAMPWKSGVQQEVSGTMETASTSRTYWNGNHNAVHWLPLYWNP
jgi:hypothetical protein